MNRKEREMQQRKMDIVNAARELFLTKEYEQITMEEIAKKAEFTRRTLYSYFKNKLDLLMLVVVYDIESSRVEYESAVDRCEKVEGKLLAFANVYYQLFKNTPGYYRLIQIYDLAEHGNIQVLSPAVKSEMENSDFSLEKFAKNIISEGITNGTFDLELNPDLATAFFLKSLLGIVHQYIFHPQFPESYYFKEVKYLMRGLGCKIQ
jgi:AcrR family transcriptional regulator